MYINYEDLEQFRTERTGSSIAYPVGCFDLLHKGHLELLTTVRKLGDIALVGMTPDAKIKARKGPTRPIQSEATRMVVVDAIKSVDYAFVTPASVDGYRFANHAVLQRLQPDVFVTGESIWENDRGWLKEQGTELHIMDRPVDDESTTKTINCFLDKWREYND